jgi:CMP-N-acetylneuraminic acid synthetase
MKVVALLPMRAMSERVPGKNKRLIAGRPLYRHVLDALLACDYVESVLIDTDSHEIIDQVEGLRRVRTILRPEHLRDGSVPMNAVLLYDLDFVEADLVLQTHATNPFLSSATITNAIQSFIAEHVSDSLFSVTRLQKRIWWPDGRPVNHDPKVLLRTQDLPPIFEENSCLYLFPPQLLRDTGNRVGSAPLLFEIDRLEAWDIDDQIDWDLAELLAGRMLANRP